MKPEKRGISPGVWTALAIVVALGLWEWAAALGHVNEFFFSRPSLLWQEFLTMVSSGMLAKHLTVTCQEAGLGLLFGGVLGTLAGLGLGMSPRVSRALMPLMTGLNGLPKLALGPLFIIWFGLGLQSKVLISALMVFFVFAFNLYAGVRSVDQDLIGAVRLLGGSRGQIMGKVIWPACLPWFKTFRSPTAAFRRCAALTWRCPTARSSPSSARTARANPPRCAPFPALSRPSPAPSPTTARS